MAQLAPRTTLACAPALGSSFAPSVIVIVIVVSSTILMLSGMPQATALGAVAGAASVGIRVARTLTGAAAERRRG